MSYIPNGFVQAVGNSIKNGEATLEWCIGAYNWANLHLKEIHKYHPKYTQDWLRTEVKRVFNVDPLLYVRVAHHVGGGRQEKHFSVGQGMLNRFGFFELYRADKLLTQEQMAKLPSLVSNGITVDELHEIVDDMAAVLKTKDDRGRPHSVDYRREYLRLMRENAELKKEVQMLREWKRKFESYIVASSQK